MDDERADMMAQFMAITSTEADVAVGMLEASDYDLEAAVNLFFTAGLSAVAGSTALAPVDSSRGDYAASEELARRMQQEAEAQIAEFALPNIPRSWEQQVRAADVVRTERLYDDHHLMALEREVSAAAAPPQAMDAFRDFRAEERDDNGGPQGLAELFKPPKDLIFQGGWDAAKVNAAGNNRWLVVNIQDNEEFASHQLNRDTWADETVKTMLKTFFVFWQTYNGVDAGRRVCGFYKLERFPVVMVVDPVTGACMAQWFGFVPPRELVDKLIPFIEAAPNDGGAVQSVLKRKHSSSQPSKPHAGGSSSRPMTEDEEMALAMQMSMDAGIGAGDDQQGAESMEEGHPVVQAEVAAKALQDLPDEPDSSDPRAARVAIRLPDGQRIQRRFPKDCPVKALRDFCLVSVPEAAGGRAFSLKPAFPGANPLEDSSQTLAAAGVAGAIVVMSWCDLPGSS